MNRTTMLFSTPSFLGGLSSVLDLGSTLTVYNTSDSSEEADANAIYSDWAAVGDDIFVSIDKWEVENDKK